MLILTVLSYILFILSLFHTSLYPALILVKACRKRSLESINTRTDRSLTIIIPSKNEPLDILLENIYRIEKMKHYDEIIIVLDDDMEYVQRLISSISSDFFVKNIIVTRVNGYGGRNGALTDGAKMALAQNILTIDVDTIPTEDFLYNARRCEDVCIGIWRPYVEINTRVEESMAYITRFGSWIFYELRSRLNLFLYPLGAGTVIDKHILKKIGFWRTDVVQDDIWLGYELIERGIKPKLINKYIDIGVPRTLEGSRIQQCRWSYGALNIVSRFIGKILRSPIRLSEKIEALVYAIQPLASIYALASFFIALVASIYEKNIFLDAIYIIPIVFMIIVQSIVLNIYSLSIYDLRRWKRIYLSGRTGALYTLLSPILGYYALKGLLRMRQRYKITPKAAKLNTKKFIDISEVIALILSLPTIIFSLINKNYVTLLISLPLALVAIYSLFRLEK